MSFDLPDHSSPRGDRPQDEWFLSFLLEHIPDRIYFKDRESRFLRVSRAMAEFFGLEDPSETIGKTDFDFFTREHAQPAFDDEQEIMRSGEPIVGKVEKETRPGQRAVWAMTTKMPLRDASGTIVGTCGISKDFTAQKELEESLEHSNALLVAKQAELQETLDELRATHERLKAAQRQLIEAEKIQSLGRLAFGVAHEVRNPLNILNMAVEFLGQAPAVAADATLGAILSSMKDAVARADSVVTELVDAAGESELVRERLPIGPVVRGVVESHADALARARVAADVEMPDELPHLLIDRKKIEEMLSAILDNALDAMPQGGRLVVRGREMRLTEAETDVGSRSAKKLRAGDRLVRIEIADNGVGIVAEKLGNVFDPFFTTKPTGAGMGLGLTVCRKTVELHGGQISVESEPGKGTRVIVDLPVEE